MPSREEIDAIVKPVDFQITDEQLHKVLTEIDAELRVASPQVYGRELRGWGAFCRRFKLTMAMHDPLATRIFDWFTKQYGERLNGNLDFGNTVAEIRHDFYSIRIPRFFGTGIIHSDPVLTGMDFGSPLVNRGPFRANLFNNLEGLTPEFIKSLTPQECNNLLDAYGRGFLGFSRMEDVQGAPYSKEALDDLRQSSSHLTDHKPNFGFSRWSSLQAVEKILKSYIEEHGAAFKKTHRLSDLALTATLIGLPSLPSTLLQDVQCTADVRYSAHSVSRAEALKAHYAALILCATVAQMLKQQSGWVSSVTKGSCEFKGERRPIKVLRVTRGKPR
jgi:hypothetical protein